MDKLKELMLKLLEDGKSEEEIVAEVAANEEVVAEIPAEGDEATAEEIAVEVEKAFKVIKASKTFKAKKDNDAKEIEAQKAIDARVKKALEGMKIDEPKEEQKEIKSYNYAQRKFISSKGITEGQKALCDLLLATASKDKSSARSIQKDIEADWKSNADRYGMPDMKTALSSDATTGSYLIPAEVAMDIMDLAYQQSVMAGLCNQQAVIYESKLTPLIYGGDLAWIASQDTAVADKTPTIANPTLTAARFGGIYLAANQLLEMKGEALVSAFMAQGASKVAEFIDRVIPCASADGSGSDSIDGILFNSGTSFVIDAVASALTYENTIDALIADIDSKIPTANMTLLANRKIKRAIAKLEDGAGRPYFPEFFNTGSFAPEGIRFVENTRIPSTLDIATDEPLTGSNDALILADFSKVYMAMDQLRIAESDHYKFAEDQKAWRLVGRSGVQIMSTSSTAGKVVAALEITN